jgi:hypothetical protein
MEIQPGEFFFHKKNTEALTAEKIGEEKKG